MPGKKVPQELWGYAIDFLRDDKASLKRCSLVCRGWLPPTRLHLFSTFEVDTRRDPLAEFAKLRDASADILKTPIRRYIRRLRLVLRDADDTLPMLMYPEDALKPIPPLPNVTCLVLEYSRQRAPDTDQYWRRLMTLVPKVTSLELSDILFHSNEDIVSILIALPHLRQLRLDRVFLFSMLSESSDTTSTLDLVPQSIDEVEVDLVTCSPGIIQRLLTAPLGASLRKLVCCLREGHGIEQEIFQSILQRSAGSLEIIELTIKGG
ncbi:hypothetical protein CERSUDRAFT_97401 [Gelatoporia subvermispora B]|uniref:F-box domain-containing protein n=1 Tax=Ceriporiopsis subvermispora (strain B) TaxID=914234 RepID=M2QRL0_CERS8|nr:hypothetical protein CERSUDRAFT_97401 [Gelatoporia subvermispora B]